MIKMYSWEMSLFVLIAILMFFIVMILRKQLFDWFNFSINIWYTLGFSLGLTFIVGWFFSLGYGFIAGIIGIIIGCIISAFTGSDYEGSEGDEGGWS